MALVKSFIHALIVFALFMGVGIYVSQCSSTAEVTAPSLWKQFTRRLFDEDVPKDAGKVTPEEHDMTGI